MSTTTVQQQNGTTNGNNDTTIDTNTATGTGSHPTPDQVTALPLHRFLIDASNVGGIIGKQGSNVKTVRESTGAFISIGKVEGITHRKNNNNNSINKHIQYSLRNIPDRVLNIRGEKDQVVKAIKQILNILTTTQQQNEGNNNNRNNINSSTNTNANGNQSVIKYLTHKLRVGSIIGREGSVIQELQTTYNVKVQISNQTLPNSTDKTITVIGSPENIANALQHIIDILDENPLRDNTREYQYQPGFNTSLYPYDQPHPHYSNLLYPPIISGIPTYADVNVTHPHQHPQQHQHQQQQTQKIAIPSNTAGAIIGHKGKTIKELRLRTGCIISIADTDNNQPNERVVTLTGSTQAIHLAIISIRHIVAQQSANNNGNQSNNQNNA